MVRAPVISYVPAHYFPLNFEGWGKGGNTASFAWSTSFFMSKARPLVRLSVRGPCAGAVEERGYLNFVIPNAVKATKLWLRLPPSSQQNFQESSKKKLQPDLGSFFPQENCDFSLVVCVINSKYMNAFFDYSLLSQGRVRLCSTPSMPSFRKKSIRNDYSSLSLYSKSLEPPSACSAPLKEYRAVYNGHILKLLTEALSDVLLQGGANRWYYTEQSVALSADMTSVSKLFVRVGVPFATVSKVLARLSSVVSGIMSQPTEELIGGGSVCVPFTELPEQSSSGIWCKATVRQV